ncbi:uncharacterized protein LOC132713303 isoform X2 [Ruditapes philippinarum]|uniref:uncharacterized protein LOC132713303 isoform X2 n=1 Tax=Ruditapes philippinarum TaxID=129788 RepID=UPI00295A7DF0|nr:uncharacterized protein LOC132713303 isoform X2 [Ruditapes philippinarum]
MITFVMDLNLKVKKQLFVRLVVLAACLELVQIPLLVTRFLPRHTETMFCFNNENIDNIKGKPEWTEHLKPKKVDGSYCVEASKAIYAIVSKMTEARYDKDANPGQSSNIFWKSDLRVGSDVQYLDEEGAISIKKSGHYFINVQLTIRMNVGSFYDNVETKK